MTTFTKSGSFGWAGGGKNGATVDLWAASRFSGPPAENTAPPAGNPDAGPVTTGTNFGAPGAYLITGIAVAQDYYIRVQYGGNTYWAACPISTLGGFSTPGWPTVNGSGPGNLNAETGISDTVGYKMTDRGTGGIVVDSATVLDLSGDDGVNMASTAGIVNISGETGLALNSGSGEVHIDGADGLAMDQIATPTNPPSGSNKLYFKSDGNLYKLDSSGVETLIG